MNKFQTFLSATAIVPILVFSGCTDENTVDLTEQNMAYTIEQVQNSDKIIVEEFSDIECPACRNFAPTFEKVMADMPDVEFRYYHFPLEQIHDFAYAGAIATECAGLLGGEEMRNKYLSTAMKTSPLSNEAYVTIAKDLSLNEEEFKTCFTERQTRNIVKNHTQEATTRGVNSTPTLFINGEKLEGGRTEAELKKRIQALKDNQ